jgi:hypothetical protein
MVLNFPGRGHRQSIQQGDMLGHLPMFAIIRLPYYCGGAKTLTTDECDAAYLAYNSLTEIVKGANDVSGFSQPGKERMRCLSEARSATEQKAASAP